MNALYTTALSNYLYLRNKVRDRKGDDYGEKAVILVVVVLLGVAAFSLFGNKIVDLVDQATAGI